MIKNENLFLIALHFVLKLKPFSARFSLLHFGSTLDWRIRAIFFLFLIENHRQMEMKSDGEVVKVKEKKRSENSPVNRSIGVLLLLTFIATCYRHHKLCAERMRIEQKEEEVGLGETFYMFN